MNAAIEASDGVLAHSLALAGYVAPARRRDPWIRLYAHGQGGAYIALVAALLVSLPGAAATAVWIVPTLIGLPLIERLVSHIREGLATVRGNRRSPASVLQTRPRRGSSSFPLDRPKQPVRSSRAVTMSGRGAQPAESPALRGFHGPGRTRTCDRRIMSYASGVRPYLPEGLFRASKRPEFC
jgi:hypothetical protein